MQAPAPSAELNLTELAMQASRLLEQRLQRSRAPALAAAVVTRNGIVWSGAQGVRSKLDATPVTHADRWHLGSNAKAMTAAVYARLVQAELATWSAPLTELFPDLRMDPAWDEVTISDLMRHRSGLNDRGLADAKWVGAAWNNPASVMEQRTELAARALQSRPRGSAKRFAYSNANYVLVGAAIERIPGHALKTTAPPHAPSAAAIAASNTVRIAPRSPVTGGFPTGSTARACCSGRRPTFPEEPRPPRRRTPRPQPRRPPAP